GLFVRLEVTLLAEEKLDLGLGVFHRVARFGRRGDGIPRRPGETPRREGKRNDHAPLVLLRSEHDGWIIEEPDDAESAEEENVDNLARRVAIHLELIAELGVD